jgi:hypothetical protein
MARTLALFSGLAALSGLLMLVPAQPLSAAKRPESVETSLLGIRVLNTYRTVLAKYGQPTRIYRNGETVELEFIYDANGNPTGGIRGLGDSANTGGGPGMMGGGGRPGMGGGPGMMGGGRPGGYPGMSGGPGMMGGGRPGGYPGMSGGPGMMGGGRPGGYPGMSGGPGMGGPGMSGGGRPGLGGGLGASTGQNGTETFSDAGGFQWVYFYPKQELVYWFVFNKDGRVLAMIEAGRNLGQKTSRGLGLGDPVKSVYTTYGWPDLVEQQGQALSLRYNDRHHVQFNIMHNKVTVVAVFLSEASRFYIQDINGPAQNGGGPGLAGGGPRRPGVAGGGGGPRRPGFAGGGGGGKD